MLDILNWFAESWARVVFILVVFFSLLIALLDIVSMLTNKSYTITECINDVGREYEGTDEPVQTEYIN